MKQTFYDLMDTYGDDSVELEDAHITDADRIMALTMEKLGPRAVSAPTQKQKARPVRKGLRIGLIAAMFALALSVTAYAVYQYTMTDRSVAQWTDVDDGDNRTIEFYAYSPVGMEQHSVADDGELQYYSGAGGPEYAALQEWTDYFLSDHEDDYDELLPADDFHKVVYAVGWKAMAEKLDALAEKYGLRLRRSEELYGEIEDLYTALDLDAFLPETWDLYTSCAVVYDDNSFRINGMTIGPDEEDLTISEIERNVKGYFHSNFIVSVESPDSFAYASYVTASGVTVDIAVGVNEAMIFAELDGCYVTVKAHSSSGAVAMEKMEAIADSINFAALAM